MTTLVDDAEHPSGAAFSYKYGNLRDPAKQRAENTRLDDPRALDEEEVEVEYRRNIARAKEDSLKEVEELHPPPPATPAVGVAPTVASNLPEETPECDVEVKEECMLQIMSGDTTDSQIKQGIIDGFTHGSRDNQLMKANALLAKKGKSAEERIDCLEKFEKNRRASRGD